MSEKADYIKKTCYHCGDLCSAGSLHHDSKDFCCRGCKTVYEILTENNLVEYYDIEANPGIKTEDKNRFSDYAYLDIPEVRKELLTFSSGDIESVKLGVPGIHCSSCIWLLENLHQINKAVIKSEVNFLKKEVYVQYQSDKLSLREVAELLESVGYKPFIEIGEKERTRANKKRDLSYIYKLGISGFAFGNIMLLSFPEYFSGGMYDDVDFGAFFGYVNLVFALPVFFYCSSSYFASAWSGLKNKYLNIDVPISLGILILFLRSTYEVLTESGAGYFDSMTGLVFFLLVGRWFQNRTYQALSFERDYRSYFPLGVSRMVRGKPENVQLKDVKVGDEIIVHNGEIIPADASLLKGSANIDYSFVTGEADPVKIGAGELLFAGGRQIGEKLHVVIEKEFSQSYLMQLWKYEKKEESDERNMSRMIDNVSQYFTAIILIVAIAAGFYWYIVDPSLAIHAFSSVLIIACPCALALTIPFTFGNGMRRLEKAGIYLRDSRFIEVFSGIDTIVFDKTGTITSQKNKSVKYDGNELSKEESAMVFSLCQNSAHPLSRMIVDHLDKAIEMEIAEFEEVEGMGLKGVIDGREILIGSSEFTGMTMRTEGSAVYVKIDGNEKGVFNLANQYRGALGSVVNELEKKFELKVITGDGDAEQKNLQKYFGEKADLHFKMNPFEKRKFILDLKEQGKTVMMIGDGLNDAGAIRESHVGVSISDDIFGFLPSCDAILEATSFDYLARLLAYSRQLKTLVKVGFIISFLYNLVGLFFAIQGILSPVVAAILMPISSITVVSFAIFSTNNAARKHKIF